MTTGILCLSFIGLTMFCIILMAINVAYSICCKQLLDKTIKIHFILIAIYAIGMIGAIVTGAIWLFHNYL